MDFSQPECNVAFKLVAASYDVRMPGRTKSPGILMRFSIRDLLWLFVVSAMAALLWRDRLRLKTERESLHKEVAVQQDALKAKRAELDKMGEDAWKVSRSISARASSMDREVREKVQQILDRSRPPLKEAELEQIKQKSAELGAPQPAPLPQGYGENPN